MSEDKTTKKVKALLDKIYEIPGGRDCMDNILKARDFRDTLVDVRRSKGMTQAEVATKMDISQPTFSEMETKRFPDPRLGTTRRWQMALGVVGHWTISDIPQPTEDEVTE